MDLLSVSSCVRVRMLLKNLSVSWPTLYTGKATGLSRIKRWHRTWRRTSCELSFFLGSTWQQACHCMRNICDLAITRRFDRWCWSRGLRRRAAAQRRYFGRACPSRLSTSLSTRGCSCRNQRCKQRFHVFYRAALYATRYWQMAIVNPSVSLRLSVCQTRELWQNERNFRPNSYTI